MGYVGDGVRLEPSLSPAVRTPPHVPVSSVRWSWTGHPSAMSHPSGGHGANLPWLLSLAAHMQPLAMASRTLDSGRRPSGHLLSAQKAVVCTDRVAIGAYHLASIHLSQQNWPRCMEAGRDGELLHPGGWSNCKAAKCSRYPQSAQPLANLYSATLARRRALNRRPLRLRASGRSFMGRKRRLARCPPGTTGLVVQSGPLLAALAL